MEHGQPSRTALATAYARAYHQMADEPRLFTDPLAVRILGVAESVIAERNTAPGDQPGDESEWPRRRRMFLAARAVGPHPVYWNPRRPGMQLIPASFWRATDLPTLPVRSRPPFVRSAVAPVIPARFWPGSTKPAGVQQVWIPAKSMPG
ncbi:hypothetical protein [Nocardia acidivorans]|uniref:hypothetical protein n=1 Tax=Nocardia acidivorans TaxID=404580 RepID=UPI00082C5A06|nr:hypothetical protein [Nocardia acidivorans]